MEVQFVNESEISDVASKATSAPSKVVMEQLKRNRSTAKGILTKKRNKIELLINKFESSAAVEFKLLELRLSSWEDQAGVMQAISPISMKLGQNEGNTKKSSQTKWVGFGIFLKVISPPPGFRAKILKI